MVDPKHIPHECRCEVCGNCPEDNRRELELKIKRYEDLTNDQGRVLVSLRGMLTDIRGMAFRDQSELAARILSLIADGKNPSDPWWCPDCKGKHAHDPDYECPCACHKKVNSH